VATAGRDDDRRAIGMCRVGAQQRERRAMHAADIRVFDDLGRIAQRIDARGTIWPKRKLDRRDNRHERRGLRHNGPSHQAEHGKTGTPFHRFCSTEG
jgi:hypothetical protein